MMRIVSAWTALVVGMLFASTAGASDRPAPGVAEIFRAWSKRAAMFKGGEIRWTLPARQWNPFGRFDTDWVPSSGAAAREIVGSVRFDEQRARYDSMTFSYTDLLPSPGKLPLKSESYEEVLWRGFGDPKTEYRDLLSYTVLYSDTQWIHYWHGGSNDYPRAVILSGPPTVGLRLLTEYTALNSDAADHPSGAPSTELHEWLAAPVILAFRPRLFDEGVSREAACRIDESARPIYEGRSCRVLHVAALSKDSPSALSAIERVYWVDPSRDFLVVRCFLVVHGGKQGEVRTLVQLDIHYDEVADLGWVPATWTVMRLGLPAFIVQQVATARRTNVDLHRSAPESTFDVQFAPGTWVKDTAANRHFFVDDKLRRREINEPYPAADHYRYFAEHFRRDTTSTRWYRSKDLRRTLLGLVQWPGVLIPLGMIVGAFGLAKAIHGLGQRLRHRRVTAIGPPSPLRDEVAERQEMS